MEARVKLLGRFARNRPIRSGTKPPLSRQILTTDPPLGEEVTTAIRPFLRAFTLSDHSVDLRETVFATVILQAAEALVLQQERMAPESRWSADAQTEVKLNRLLALGHLVWQRVLRNNTH